MYETERLGVQGLPGADGETIVDELSVFREGGSFENLVAPISCIVEEGMSFMLHVYAYLVSASGLKNTFDKGHVAELLQNLIVGDGMFADRGIGEDGHLEFIAGIAGDVAGDCPRL